MIKITDYAKGKGVDVSKTPSLNSATHKFIEPDNFYSLKSVAKPETLGFVYSNGLINETKFHRILLKEWFYACKVGGNVIIEMTPNKLLDFNALVSEAKLLLGGKTKIIKKQFDKKTGKGILIIQKTKPALAEGDSMDKWTFGIITDGKRQEWVDNEIESIFNLNIPQTEVVICGAYAGKFKDRIKLVPVDSKVAWICKKKNMIAENAKHENLVITHDKYLFDRDWHDGMKKYGNYFDVLSCVIKETDGRRSADWVTLGTHWDKIAHSAWLQYRDWDKYGYIGGGFYILKKSAWKKSKWDEKLLWNQAEDVKLSRDWYDRGVLARFNPDAECTILLMRHIGGGICAFNPKKLGRCLTRPPMFYAWYAKEAISKHLFNVRPTALKMYNYYIKLKSKPKK